MIATGYENMTENVGEIFENVESVTQLMYNKLRRKTIFYRLRCNCCVYSSIMIRLACVYSYYGTPCTRAPVNGLHNILFSSTEFALSLVCVPNVSANREDRIQSRTHSFSVIRIRKQGEEKLNEENNYATRYTFASN